MAVASRQTIVAALLILAACSAHPVSGCQKTGNFEAANNKAKIVKPETVSEVTKLVDQHRDKSTKELVDILFPYMASKHPRSHILVLVFNQMKSWETNVLQMCEGIILTNYKKKNVIIVVGHENAKFDLARRKSKLTSMHNSMAGSMTQTAKAAKKWSRAISKDMPRDCKSVSFIGVIKQKGSDIHYRNSANSLATIRLNVPYSFMALVFG